MSLRARIGELESRVASLPAHDKRVDLDIFSVHELRQMRELCIKAGGTWDLSKLSDDDLILLKQLRTKAQLSEKPQVTP